MQFRLVSMDLLGAQKNIMKCNLHHDQIDFDLKEYSQTILYKMNPVTIKERDKYFPIIHFLFKPIPIFEQNFPCIIVIEYEKFLLK